MRHETKNNFVVECRTMLTIQFPGTTERTVKLFKVSAVDLIDDVLLLLTFAMCMEFHSKESEDRKTIKCMILSRVWAWSYVQLSSDLYNYILRWLTNKWRGALLAQADKRYLEHFIKRWNYICRGIDTVRYYSVTHFKVFILQDLRGTSSLQIWPENRLQLTTESVWCYKKLVQ